MPLRPNRTPKHPTSTTSASTSGPVARHLRRGVALTAVVASAVAGSALLGGESSEAPAELQTASVSVELPEPTKAELARLAESRSGERLTRSADRSGGAADAGKAQLLRAEARPGPQESGTRTVELGDPREIAQAMIAERGWSQGEFSCLDSLWVKESGWDPTAANPTSSAYGIPQALPGSKMASAGADWETNPATQIEWGLGYIAERYGTPCAAWSHSQANGWY